MTEIQNPYPLTDALSENVRLRARIAELEAALAPFAKIAAYHAGDDEDDVRAVSIINVTDRRYPTGDMRGDVWYENGGPDDPHLLRGDLRRARTALGEGRPE